MRLILLLLLLAAGCLQGGAPEGGAGGLEVRSSFSQGEAIPTKYTCDGTDISPPLDVVGVASDAKTLAIVVEDPDAPIGSFTHWLAWNLEAKEAHIPEGIPGEERVREPVAALQGTNDFGRAGYSGPCPPEGSEHRYIIRVYTLDKELELGGGSGKEELMEGMEGHILQSGKLVGVYSR